MEPGAERGALVEQVEKGLFGEKFFKTRFCFFIQQGAEGFVLSLKAQHHLAELGFRVQEGAYSALLGIEE